MSFPSDEFEFFGDMNKNIDYYLLDSNPSEKNELIKSKIIKFKKTSEFYKYYTDHDIVALFEEIDKLDKIYSNIYGKNENLQPKVDKYISDLSNIILLFNLLSKNQNIIRKALTNTESYLKDFYSENNININSKKLFKEYFDYLMNQKKKKKNKKPTILSHDNIYNKKKRHKTVKNKKPNIFIFNKKTEEKNINFNYKLINISPPCNNINNNNNKKINEDTSINDLKTPKFPQRILEDNTNYNQQNSKEIDLNKNLIIKQESIQSYYTLAAKTTNNVEEQNIPKINENNQKIEDTINNNKINNDENVEEAKLVYSKSNAPRKKNHRKKEENNESKEYYIKKTPKKTTFSSINLKSAIEKNMLKDFLGFINNIYKAGYINNEEKLKLKQLIISKSEKIQRIYNDYYKINKMEFINELKKLIT